MLVAVQKLQVIHDAHFVLIRSYDYISRYRVKETALQSKCSAEITIWHM
jgi:hypothetical protein